MKNKILTSLLIIGLNCFTTVQSDTIFVNGFEQIIIPLFKLNDTGTTWSGEYPSGNITECNSTTITSPQDCNTGRDFTHPDSTDGHAGFSFTKLGKSGYPLANQGDDYATTQWSCVQDNVTGLVWEVKTTTPGIHNQNNIYQWGGITAIGLGHQDAQGTYYEPSWNDLVQGSNDDTFCGFNDWRVPTIAELSSIVNKGAVGLAIDTNFFPNAVASRHWSSSPIAQFTDFAWTVFFFNSVDNFGNRNNSYSVRLVRLVQ